MPSPETDHPPSESAATRPKPHFVLCHQDKKPTTSRWQKNGASEESVQSHTKKGGLIGVIPGSIDCLVIDVDVGKSGDGPNVDGGGKALKAALGVEPFWIVKTRTGGLHLWYRIPADRATVGNRKWAFKGFAGDIRCDRGFVVLWNRRGFKEKVTGSNAGDLLDLARLDKIKPPRKQAAATNGRARRPQNNNRLYPPLDELDFSEGKRNESLNEGVFRRTSWGQPYDDIVAAARSAGLPKQEITTTVASARAAGETELANHPERLRASTPPPPGSLEGDPEAGGKFCYPDKNAAALEDALRLQGIEVRFNLRAVRKEVNEKGAGWQEVTDRIAADLRDRIAERYLYSTTNGTSKLKFGLELWKDKLNAILRHREVDPFIVDFLDRLPAWDGVSRLDYYLDDLFSAGKSELVQWAGRVLLLGAITRAYEPGEKLDEIPVFVGDQGIGKSMFLRTLLPKERPEWFTDGLDLSGNSKEIVEALQGRVIVEVSEMAGSTGARLERLKAFLSRQDDGGVRLSYRENPEPLPRRAVMAGTTNRTDSLPNDPSGNRRFVPVPLNAPDGAVEAFINGIREQLWAEALHRYRAGEDPRLPRELRGAAVKAAEAHRNRDELLENRIEEELEAGSGIEWLSSEWAFRCQLCDKPEDAPKVSRSDQQRLSAALENKGLVRKRVRRKSDKQKKWVWVLAEESLLK